MSIDVEGLDLNVLRSNNWEKYHPNFILVESQNSNIDHFKHSEIYQYMESKNYQLVAKTLNTFFLKSSQD